MIEGDERAMPTISVIVPVYKVEPYLRRCVDSILNQTYTDFELILVDDGSPDNCPAICDEYAAWDSRVHVIHQPNGGLSAARNAGIDWAFSNSDSEWLSFIDSDDFVTADYLEKLLYLTEKYTVDCSVIGFTATESDAGEPRRTDPVECCMLPDDAYGETFRDYRLISLTSAWGKLFRKSMMASIRFPVGKINEDSGTTYKLLFQCDRLAITTDNLYMYYVNLSSITQSKWTPARLANLDFCEQQLAYFQAGGFSKSYRRIAHDIITVADYQLDNMRSRPEYRELYDATRERMKGYIRQYGKCGNISLLKTPQYFYHIYPLLSRALMLPERVFCHLINMFSKG